MHAGGAELGKRIRCQEGTMQNCRRPAELTCLIFLGSERTREGMAANAWSTVARAGEWQRPSVTSRPRPVMSSCV